MSDPGIVHAFDQLSGTLIHVASLVAVYHKELVDGGLTREEALQHTLAWQEIFFTMFQPDGSEDSDDSDPAEDEGFPEEAGE